MSKELLIEIQEEDTRKQIKEQDKNKQQDKNDQKVKKRKKEYLVEDQ